MGTVSKAMTLLETFSVASAELGLTDLARAVAFDKATTLRLLRSLAGHGMVEQIAGSKRYRLGPAILRLARIREANFPLVEAARPVLEDLSRQTGESCHVTEASAEFMISVLVADGSKAIRVILTEGQRLPFHCTASGLAYLAFGPSEAKERVLRKPLKRLTPKTVVRAIELRKLIEATRVQGYAMAAGTYDVEAVSVAAPVCDANGVAFGSVSVATPAARMSEAVLLRHSAAVASAARDITRKLGGSPAKEKISYKLAAGRNT